MSAGRSGRSQTNPLSRTRHEGWPYEVCSLVSGKPKAIRRTSSQSATAATLVRQSGQRVTWFPVGCVPGAADPPAGLTPRCARRLRTRDRRRLPRTRSPRRCQRRLSPMRSSARATCVIPDLPTHAPPDLRPARPPSGTPRGSGRRSGRPGGPDALRPPRPSRRTALPDAHRQLAGLATHLQNATGQSEVVVRGAWAPAAGPCRCLRTDRPIRSILRMTSSSAASSRRSVATGAWRRDEGQDLLVGLQELAVDSVVVGDHQVGHREIAVDYHAQSAVELVGDEVETAQGALSRACGSRRGGWSRPSIAISRTSRRTYCSVRSSAGLVKIFSVSSTSTRSPSSMNAVTSETRAGPCCMFVSDEHDGHPAP